MKIFFLWLLNISFFALKAQTKITKYYNANWEESPEQKAVFYADFVKDGAYYNCTSYSIQHHTLRGKSTYKDTIMVLPVGLQVLYYDNGRIADSSLFENNVLQFSYHYYPNSQLAVHYFLKGKEKEGTAEGFDESGHRIKNYIFLREAEFNGGTKAWASYINKNATKNLTVKGDSAVTVSVEVEFIIDVNGDVIKPKIKKSSGYKNVDADALRVIADSPSWKNAIMLNAPVNAYRLQPITYRLQAEKK